MTLYLVQSLNLDAFQDALYFVQEVTQIKIDINQTEHCSQFVTYRLAVLIIDVCDQYKKNRHSNKGA